MHLDFLTRRFLISSNLFNKPIIDFETIQEKYPPNEYYLFAKEMPIIRKPYNHLNENLGMSFA